MLNPYAFVFNQKGNHCDHKRKEFWICFASEKNLKEDEIDKKAKTKEKVCSQFFFSFQTILKQLTLFKKISGQTEPYFKKPQSMAVNRIFLVQF